MELSDFKAKNNALLSVINGINIDQSIFMGIIDIISIVMGRLGIKVWLNDIL